MPIAFTLGRSQTTPVLTKGGTYGGWTADAIAAPSVCYDGTRYVMTVSLWSVSLSKWASAFFTSPDAHALYARDGAHPSERGTDLAARVIAETIGG